jgi:hypothetical protein
MRHVTGAVSAVVLLMSSLSWAAAPEPANDEQKRSMLSERPSANRSARLP